MTSDPHESFYEESSVQRVLGAKEESKYAPIVRKRDSVHPRPSGDGFLAPEAIF